MAQSKRHAFGRVSWGGKVIYQLLAMLLGNIVIYLTAVRCDEK